MSQVRRALRFVAAAWLLCHAATLTLAPMLFESGVAECVCTHDANAMCPMHHAPLPGKKACSMQSATTTPAPLLSALLSLAGHLPVTDRLPVPPPTAHAASGDDSPFVHLASPPDSPPPRA